MKSKTKSKSVKEITLFETNHAFTTFLLYSIIAQIKMKDNTKLIAYRPLRYRKIQDLLSFKIFSVFSIDNGSLRPYRIMKSMGISQFIQPKLLHKNEAKKLYSDVILKDKSALNSLIVKDIRIGDIFYDWHLREQLIDTVDIQSEVFRRDFLFFLSNFFAWYEFFSSNKVNSIFISHSCSDLALPARIALKFGAKVYVAAWGKIYQLKPERIFSDMEFVDYDPSIKLQLGYEVNSERAMQSFLKLRNGQLEIPAHSLGSGYSGKSRERIIRNPDNLNILIATHCFSDPPHSYGDMLFSDFYEWLKFLGDLSLRTEFDFYIKPHPSFWESDKVHYKKFLTKYPNITEVPSDFSNLELFNQGIKVVLTVYGTIAFEAAFEEILVINASKTAPHMNYKFSIFPDSIKQFEDTIIKLPSILPTWKIDRLEVLHFFDLHHLRQKNYFLFPGKGEDFINYIGGSWNQFLSPKVFDYWLNKLDVSHYELVKKRLESYFQSDDYTL